MGQRGARAQGRRDRRRVRGRNRLRTRMVLGGVALGVLSLGGGAALAHLEAGSAAPAASPQPDARSSAPASPKVPAAPSASAGHSARPSPGTSGSTRPSTSPGPSKSTVPHSGKGTFTAARAAGDKVGTGPLRRYTVKVEDGIDLSATQAAHEIEEILAHPRGWAAHGRGSFQLVDEGADFVVFIATPATADRLCLAEGLNTRGELNCETRQGVVVNLKRWMLGSPTFSGTPAEYRHLIINHEVGHEIGIRSHMGCPGPGKPAPVMMQQIKGLKGCVSNAWPYDEDGRYITGPIVP
ncbi:hypothetical protein BJP40_27980 [Streptomyces sp. CC53]|uniref:DUF3152 domain-containing protein n=1 Tax=unclassified Streptomyces TaxID=2593676 RepID=UPI0008DCFED9|nr:MULTISPECIES: DUF3152 domain-containing protein [unclassified Streptomyces]OII62635.1 hypothetical protein BJP40_27980 [Streptomyces sp. CC53]